MNIKRWEFAPFDRSGALELAKSAGVPPLLAALLYSRGYSSPEQVHALLNPGGFSDPMLMKDMDRAVARIRQALEDYESIAVYGDYDADGVTATAILYSYLRSRGAKVSFYIPQREGEGYGLNLPALDTLHREGVDLIITVDNGISAIQEIAYANSLGMDVVVTDHHQPQAKLPAACALVDAHRSDDESPFKDFSGAGVALKLLLALEDGDPKMIEQYADLAAVGTVGDSVSLTGENRQIVLAGLQQINRRPRPGLDAILDLGRDQADSSKLTFSAVPCINATGRMGSPERAVRLLLYEDAAAAGSLARELKADNALRKQVEREILQSTIEKVEQDPALRYARVIVVEGDNWHMGVVGIVAAKLTERYGKPSFVLSRQEDGCYRGSGRSVGGFSMFAAVDSCRELLTRYGGHPMAAGLTVRAENLPELRRRLNEYARENHPLMPTLTLRVDCPLKPASVSAQTVKELLPLEPFGEGNRQPLFCLQEVTLTGVIPIGSTGAHCRLRCEKDGFGFECVYFGVRPEDFPFDPGSVMDLAVNLQANDYPRGRGFDFLVRDVRLSAVDTDTCIRGLLLHEKHRRGEPLTTEEIQVLTPTREQFAALYRLLAKPGPKPSADPQALLGKLQDTFTGMGALLIALDVLEERGLIRWQGPGIKGGWQVLPQRQKADLFASPCMPGNVPAAG